MPCQPLGDPKPRTPSCVRRLCWFCGCVSTNAIECIAKVLTYLCLSALLFASLQECISLKGSGVLPAPASHRRFSDSWHVCDVPVMTAVAQVPAELGMALPLYCAPGIHIFI